MKDPEFLRSMARLESLNDYLETELTCLDSLLKSVGFEKGLETVKLASIDFLNEMSDEIYFGDSSEKNFHDKDFPKESKEDKKDL